MYVCMYTYEGGSGIKRLRSGGLEAEAEGALGGGWHKHGRRIGDIDANKLPRDIGCLSTRAVSQLKEHTTLGKVREGCPGALLQAQAVGAV
mmetsp:Transcript_70814/g.103757  ORF Transcript_70814/g.103757 Transcript_70814/m.103757 type:complete len:91 (+) Transcript_70814:254-526(+)